MAEQDTRLLLLQRQSIGRILLLLESIETQVAQIRFELTDFGTLRKALRWTSIIIGGLANVFYAGYYALATILEAEGVWSLRLWMTTQERWWYLMAILILALALFFDVWAFILGEDVDATILLLAFELGIGINRVLVQAIRTHRFRTLLYECWSGRSRTARPRTQEWLRDIHEIVWRDSIERAPRGLYTMSTESRFNPGNLGFGSRRKLRYDVTEAMNTVTEVLADQVQDRAPHDDTHIGEAGYLQVYVHHTETDMSVAWGGNDSRLFQKRCSRGIMALKASEIVNSFSLQVTDTDKWKIAADGILARNKGLQPWRLVCKRTTQPDNPAETSSPLYPRASKTLVSRVRADVHSQYSGLGNDYVEAGTELNLLIRDVNPTDVYQWLRKESEHQDLQADWQLFQDAANPRLNELAYLIHYVGMLLSLHFTAQLQHGRADEFILLVAIKCMLEDDTLDLGVPLSGLQGDNADGETSMLHAKAQAGTIGVQGIRIVAGYLGVWLSVETAEDWITWIEGLENNWQALLSL